MSKLSKGILKGILGAVAVSLTLGAAQFALGNDLSGRHQASAGTSEAAVNRAGKADRAAGVAGPGVQTQTISLRLDSLAATSVLVRMPVAEASRSGSAARSLMKPGNGKSAVACEPVVSVLTDVARQLEPGRCVT
jgi:hypothetical protein